MTTTDAVDERQAEAIIAETKDAYKRLREEVARVVVGQHEIVEMLMLALLCKGHCLVVGVPGLAKTLLIRTLASALKLKFSRVQFTPDLMPSDILGTEILHEDRESGARSLDFSPGPIFTNLLLADEINRTPPKTQAALLEAMQEKTVTCGGETHHLQEPFLVFATQNPIEHEGTYPLPEAQLDRFFLNLLITYPEEQDELAIIRQNTTQHSMTTDAIFTAEEILRLQSLVLQTPAPQHVEQYALNLVAATRPTRESATDYVKKYIEWGAGPRASIALVLAAKAKAILHGHPAASCAEVREVFHPVLRHRVIPSYHAVGEGVDVETILDHIIETTKEPEYADGR